MGERGSYQNSGVQELITSGVGHKVACVDIEGSWDSGAFGDRDIMPRGPL